MRDLIRVLIASAFGSLVFTLCVLSVTAQDEKVPVAPILVDEFGRVGDCQFSARLDTFFVELSEKPDSQGYIINYESADELPGDKGTFVRERAMTNHIAFRNFDGARITVLRGGYRTESSTELWIIPQGAEEPEPSRTVPEPKLPERQTFLFAQRSFFSEIGGIDLDEFVLESVKEREAAELAEIAGEDEASPSAEEKENATPQDKSIENDAAPDAATEDELVADLRTEEEKEAERFEWANVAIARFLSTRKAASGVLIFYADDQRFDIGKLRQFIEQGRNLLAEHGPIERRRLRIQFGGYRSEPDVEFWVVPPNGIPPVATPEDRPVEEPEETDK